MALLDILVYPDPRLKKKSKPVPAVDDEIRTLIADMYETMYESDGVGLAAPQVGILKRIIVIDCAPRYDEDGQELPEEMRAPLALVNPVITQKEGTICWEEGCLSVPDLAEEVNRAAKVTVEGLDFEGDAVSIEAEGLLSVCLQHEIDHLDGVLFVDRLSRLKQSFLKKRLKKRAAEPARV